jgi:hypothetical protein
MQEIRQQERRRSRRIRIGQPLKVRPSDPRDAHFEETNTTKNVSRDGIYFLSKNKSFYEGMRLFITLPFHFPIDPLDQEYIGQVTRIENLPDGNRGIAVQLLSSVGIKPVIAAVGTNQNY